jgi:putative transposon-encoded protein
MHQGSEKMRVEKVVRRTSYKWGTRKGEVFQGTLGLIRFPKFFIKRDAVLILDGKKVMKKFCKTGNCAVVSIPKEYIGKVIEVEFDQETVNEYFASRFKASGKRDNLPDGKTPDINK